MLDKITSKVYNTIIVIFKGCWGIMKKGEIYWVELGSGVGSEQSGTRPCLVVQNDIGNKYSPTTLICPITSQLNKKFNGTHLDIDCMTKASTILFEQMRVVDKRRIKDYITKLSPSELEKANKLMIFELGLMPSLA